MKTLILQILYFIWSVLIPAAIVVAFGIGVAFNLIYVQEFNVAVAIMLAIFVTALIGIGLAKLLKW